MYLESCCIYALAMISLASLYYVYLSPESWNGTDRNEKREAARERRGERRKWQEGIRAGARKRKSDRPCATWTAGSVNTDESTPFPLIPILLPPRSSV